MKPGKRPQSIDFLSFSIPELEGDFGNQSSGCEQRRSTENEEDNAMEDDFDLGDDLGGCEDEDDDDDECDSDYSEDSAGEERKAHSTHSLDWHLLYITEINAKLATLTDNNY